MRNTNSAQPQLQTSEGCVDFQAAPLPKPSSFVLGKDITAKALGTEQLLAMDFAFRNVRPSNI